MHEQIGLLPPEPVIVIDLFSEILVGLTELLSGLNATDWQKPTVCQG